MAISLGIYPTFSDKPRFLGHCWAMWLFNQLPTSYAGQWVLSQHLLAKPRWAFFGDWAIAKVLVRSGYIWICRSQKRLKSDFLIFWEASASVARARGPTGTRARGPAGPPTGPTTGPSTGPRAHPRAHGPTGPRARGPTGPRAHELMPRTWTNFCHQELVPWTWTCLKSFLIKLLHTKI